MVYFIEKDNYIKIGCTYHIKNRLSELQVSSPERLKVIGLMDGNFKVEKEMHDKFMSCRFRGEWYKKSNELMEFIHSLDQELLWEWGFLDLPNSPISKIKSARIDQGLSMQDLADMMGITKQSVYELEMREIQGTASLNTILKAANAMGVRFSYRIV